MANNIKPILESLDFHPCDTPRGMEYYMMDFLTGQQQERLNKHKSETVRDNQKYLYHHPEVRGVLQVLMRKILSVRPSHDVENFIGKYFSEEWEEITEEVEKYVEALPRKPQPMSEMDITKKDDKHVFIMEELIRDSVITTPSLTEDFVTNICKEVLEEMLENVHHELEHKKKVKTSEPIEFIEEQFKLSARSSMASDDLYLDLDLDFDLDFSTYHEEDDIKYN